jgi:hypothetical protein
VTVQIAVAVKKLLAEVLKAWVAAEVASGGTNEAEPDAGAIVRLEIVSELPTIAAANAAPLGRASSKAADASKLRQVSSSSLP